MTRIILIRHGETAHNRDRLTLGRADVPLSDRGRLQARAVARSFVNAPEAIYSSPLRRARDTAAAIAEATGVPVTVEPGLIEMDVGDMEHLSRDELRARYPDFLRAWFSDDAGDARMPGGETLREVQARAWDAIERIAAVHSGRAVAAVTHNFVLLSLACQALDLELSRFRRLRHGLGARSILEIQDGRPVLLRWNDASHLNAAGLAADDLYGGERHE